MNFTNDFPKKNIIYVLFFLIILAFVGIGIYSFSRVSSIKQITVSKTGNIEYPLKNNVYDNSQIGTTTEQPPLTENAANINNDILMIEKKLKNCQDSDYKNIENFGSDPRDAFYAIAEAMATKNVESCSYVSSKFGEEFGKMCLVKLYRVSLIDGVDVKTKLDKILSLTGNNYSERAAFEGNISFCDKVPDVISANICKAIVTLNEDYCRSFEDKTINSNLCNKIVDGKLVTGCEASKSYSESLCLNALYVYKAIKEKNVDLCSKIYEKEGDYSKIICLASLNADPLKVINEEYRKNVCSVNYFISLAQIKKDISICEQIPEKEVANKTSYENCKKQFAAN